MMCYMRTAKPFGLTCRAPYGHVTPGRVRSISSRTCRVAAKAAKKPPFGPKELPNPYMHERAVYNDGKATLRSCLYDTLRPHQAGLKVDALVNEVQGTSGLQEEVNTSKAEKELGSSPYFHKKKDGTWALSVYQPLKWGVVGTGAIAEDVCEVINLIPGANPFWSCAAKDSQKDADEFAEKHDMQHAYADTDGMVKDEEVDIVYVANVHIAHKATCLPLLAAGKNVLCEKPLSVNAKETREIYKAADDSKKFFLVGLWSRFFPAQQKLRQLIDSGQLGEVLHFHGSICLPMGEEVSRLYDPEAGGGALLDIGLYMLTLASWVYGCQKPNEVKASAVMHKNGIDVSGVISLKFGQKGLASIVYSMEAEQPIEATITGSKGSVVVHDRAHNPTSMTFLPKDGRRPQLMEFPQPDTPESIDHGPADGGFNFGGSMGFLYEIMAVHSAVVNGHRGYDDVHKEEIINVMEVADEIRRQIGVKYPQDD